jgi:hypothetical protein
MRNISCIALCFWIKLRVKNKNQAVLAQISVLTVIA